MWTAWMGPLYGNRFLLEQCCLCTVQQKLMLFLQSVPTVLIVLLCVVKVSKLKNIFRSRLLWYFQKQDSSIWPVSSGDRYLRYGSTVLELYFLIFSTLWHTWGDKNVSMALYRVSLWDQAGGLRFGWLQTHIPFLAC